MPIIAAQSVQTKPADSVIYPEGTSLAKAKTEDVVPSQPILFSSGQPDVKTSAASPSARIVDPITAAGNVVWYVRPPVGGQYGPARGGILRQWLAEGRVTPDTLVWREGWRDWQKASAVFPQLRISGSLAESSLPSVKSLPTISAVAGQKSYEGKSPKIQKVILSLLILALIFLLGIFFWLIIHGLTSGGDNSAPLDSRQNTRYTQSSPHSIKPDRPPH